MSPHLPFTAANSHTLVPKAPPRPAAAPGNLSHVTPVAQRRGSLPLTRLQFFPYGRGHACGGATDGHIGMVLTALGSPTSTDSTPLMFGL